MSDVVVFVATDSAETVKHFIAKGLPLEDLVEYFCVNCQQSVFLTKKQLEAYQREATCLGETKPLAFECMECYVAKVKAKRAAEEPPPV